MFIDREGPTQSSTAKHLDVGVEKPGLLIHMNLTLSVVNRTSWHGNHFSSANFDSLSELCQKVFPVCLC